MDFTGKVRDRASLSYDYPDPQVLFAHLQKQLNELPAHIGSPLAERILGVGIAAQVQAVTALPVQQVKDTAAACVAELVAGPRAQRTQLCP